MAEACEAPSFPASFRVARRAVPCVQWWKCTPPPPTQPHLPSPPAGQHGARGGTGTRRVVLRLACARLHPPSVFGRDALRRVRSHPPFLPQNTQKPLRGTLKTQKSGSLSYISNTFRVFSGKGSPLLTYPASGRLTRSARRHEDTESDFEVGLRTASSSSPSILGGDGHGPVREVPAPPPARGVRTVCIRRREGRATTQPKVCESSPCTEVCGSEGNWPPAG